MRQLIFPATILMFALISLSALMSIAPSQAVRQLVFFALGILGFIAVSRLSFDSILRLSPVLYLGLNSLLVFTLAFATITRGTARWISIGNLFVLQPSQLAIPITALFLLNFLKQNKISQSLVFVKTLIFIAIPAVLILVEPDLDTTIVMTASLMTIIWFAKSKTKHLILLGLSGVIMAIMAWNLILENYQKERFYSFFEGKQEEQLVHYNAQQALIAIGSGQVSGKGLGEGVQSHLQFLPERQTDFMFASLAEEYGFLGSLSIIVLYLVLVAYCVYVGLRSKNASEQLFCFTVAAAIFFQSAVNISMNLGMIPIAGLTLPLMSYGGSSVIATCLMLGVMQILTREPGTKFRLHIT